MRETLTEGAKIDRCCEHIRERNETRIDDVLRRGNGLVGILLYFSRKSL